MSRQVTSAQNNSSVNRTRVQTSSKGILTALTAFLIWGCFPFYFKQLAEYNAVEIIGHRIVWTFICLLLVIVFSKRWHWIELFKANPKLLALTFFSGSIITMNWLVYVWAVNVDQILEASLGYFISPLLGILLSLIFLKERLRPLQWIAVAFAVTAVVIQLIMLGSLPWVSLVLAASFSVYGLMQRRTPLHAIDALFVETALLVPIFIWWFVTAEVSSSSLSFWFSNEIWFLMLAGPITLIPLLLFNKSTKMVAFSILSFMNYITPIMIFLLAIFYYHEPFDSNRLIIFALIWVGLVIFSIDLWQNRPSKIQKNLSSIKS